MVLKNKVNYLYAKYSLVEPSTGVNVSQSSHLETNMLNVK